MPKQDYVKSWARHAQAVNEVVADLRGLGLKEMAWAHDLPPFSFALAPRRGIDPATGQVPRDLAMRLAHPAQISVKIYRTNGDTHSSVYRSVAYTTIADASEPYLQLVTGESREPPIKWLDGIQPPLDPEMPTGIHSAGAVLAALRKAVAARRSTLAATDLHGDA